MELVQAIGENAIQVLLSMEMIICLFKVHKNKDVDLCIFQKWDVFNGADA